MSTEKIQVGPDVWIRPNKGMQMPKEGDKYYSVIYRDHIDISDWTDDVIDFAFYQVGNCFPTREAAEASIIKPADPTPITYQQWVDAGLCYRGLMCCISG